MRYNTTTLSVAIAIVFAAGLGASSLGRYAVSTAGTIVTNGPVKAIAIKIPPQPKDDVVFVD